MALTPRAKKYTDYGYLITNPASENDVRSQMDGAVQEVFDIVQDETALKTELAIVQRQLTYGVDVGSTDAYTITLNPAPYSYFAGMRIAFKANTVNTGSTSLNVNGLGDVLIKKASGASLVVLGDGDIVSGQIVQLIHDGTFFQMVSPFSSTITNTGIVTRKWSSAVNLDTTPTVLNVNGLLISNTSATSITEFDDGTISQEVTILFTTSNTTLVNSSTLRLEGNINWNPTANSSITIFKYPDTSAWFEKSRMKY